MLTFSFMSSYLFLLSLLSFFISFILWFYVRRKRIELHFPLLKLFSFEKAKPKFTFQLPNLVVFLCFILFGLCFVLFTLGPEYFHFEKKKDKRSKLHLLVDLSPSVSGTLSIQEYQSLLKKFIKANKDQYQISASHTQLPKEMKRSELEAWISELSFQKRTLKIAESALQALDQDKNLDTFIIVSDKDQHSWKDFHNKQSDTSLPVYWVQAKELSPRGSNLYFSGIFPKEMSDHSYLWEIHIRRSGAPRNDSGDLVIKQGNRVLKSSSWALESHKKETVINLSLDHSTLEKTGVPLNFQLKAKQKDLISLDNEWKTRNFSLFKKATLIIDPKSESLLHDPAYYLENALHLLGYQIERKDWITKDKSEASPGDLTISFIKNDLKDLDSYCPEKSQDKKTWISPENPSKDFTSLCSCVKKLLPESQISCKSPLQGNLFSTLLQEDGFKQLGGEAAFAHTAFAWEKNKLRVFLLPIKPSLMTGLSHSKFPRLLQEILKEKEPSKDSLKDENVPLGESLLEEVPSSKLPPVFNKESLQEELLKKERSPVQYLIILFLLSLMLITLLLESLYHIFKKEVPLILLLGFFFLSPEKAFGTIELIYLTGNNQKNKEFTQTSQELEKRTSLTLFQELQIHNQYSLEHFYAPWLWIHPSFPPLKNKREEFHTALSRWIKQGGFLVLEENFSQEDLNKISQSLDQDQKHRWKTVPVDHELLKSFYLLNTLPSCSQENWKILEYDKRLVAISIPFSLIETLQNGEKTPTQDCSIPSEMFFRSFVNINMVALSTDYKKDQIHLDEILKRLK